MNSNAEIDVPVFGLGCAPIGNLYRPLSDAQATGAGRKRPISAISNVFPE